MSDCPSVSRTRRGPLVVAERTDFGLAELAPDADRPGCWTLLLNGQPHSHVDTRHPARLHFEYMRLLGLFADLAAPPGVPLRVLHVGGGAMTLARYLEATRPRSAQLVIEHDAALSAFVRRVLPLPRRAIIRVRQASAPAALDSLPRGRFDLVLADFPALAQTAPTFVSQVERILDPRGIYAANLIGSPALHEHAVWLAFGGVCTLHCGRRSNTVLAARKELPLPEPPIRRAAARMDRPITVHFR